MRTVHAERGSAPASVVDYKASPQEVLEEVDALLLASGLEVVLIDEGDDAFHFRIAPRFSPAAEA